MSDADLPTPQPMSSPSEEIQQGVWGSWHGRPIELGRWYRNGKGCEFIAFEAPRRVAGRPGYWTGDVLLRDGRVDLLVWGPETRAIPSWRRKLLRRALPSLAREIESVVDAMRAGGDVVDVLQAIGEGVRR